METYFEQCCITKHRSANKYMFTYESNLTANKSLRFSGIAWFMVHLQVSIMTLLKRKSSASHICRMGTLSHRYGMFTLQMAFQMSFLGESLRTKLACIRFFASVNSHVLGEGKLVLESPGTQVTL